MTGKDLLVAMSLVDEKYVDEAENKRLKRSLPMGWLSMAACLCILIGGAIFWLQPRCGSDCAPMENAAAGGSMLMDEETQASMEQVPEMNAGDSTQEMTSIPTVYIRIREWAENGFIGVVEDASGPDAGNIASGTTLTVYFDENTNIVMQTDGQLCRWEERMPTEEDFPVGTLVWVQYAAVEADGSIVAAVIDAAEEGAE